MQKEDLLRLDYEGNLLEGGRENRRKINLGGYKATPFFITLAGVIAYRTLIIGPCRDPQSTTSKFLAVE